MGCRRAEPSEAAWRRRKIHPQAGARALCAEGESLSPETGLCDVAGAVLSRCGCAVGGGGAFGRGALPGEAMGDCGLFDMRAIGRIADAHLSGSADNSHALWSLLM